MTDDRFRLRSRALAAAAVAAIAVAGLAACGDDDDPQALTFTVNGSKITGPGSAETGSAEITVDNSGKKPADLQLLRVEGDRSPQEFIKAFAAVLREGATLPDWMFAAGGVGTTEGGQSQTVTETLEPGTYYGVNTSSTGPPPKPDQIAAIEVTGEASDEELEADTEVEAIDYGFKASGLKAGENEILFANTGAQPHHIVAAPLAGGATEADAKKYFASANAGGPPPIRQKGTQNTAVLEGGDSQLVTLDLPKGNYVLLCFINDRQGGPEHVAKGMVTGVEVK
jgi:hypothetical protein